MFVSEIELIIYNYSFCMSVYKDIVAGILRDHIMDDILIADYLLFVLNQHQQFK